MLARKLVCLSVLFLLVATVPVALGSLLRNQPLVVVEGPEPPPPPIPWLSQAPVGA